MTNRKATASLRSGLITASDDVHGRIHDDPHYVDEVPVDPRDLDAVVVRRGVVTAERAGRRKGEQGQPDEDVCAVEPREAVEDRRERAVLRREPDPRVLEELREQERKSDQE